MTTPPNKPGDPADAPHRKPLPLIETRDERDDARLERDDALRFATALLASEFPTLHRVPKYQVVTKDAQGAERLARPPASVRSHQDWIEGDFHGALLTALQCTRSSAPFVYVFGADREEGALFVSRDGCVEWPEPLKALQTDLGLSRLIATLETRATARTRTSPSR